jgi:soluble lytic murein transglycosylase-like protein
MRSTTPWTRGGPLRAILAVGALCFLTGLTWAQWHPRVRVLPGPLEIAAPESWDACIRDAARLSGVDAAVIRAIVAVESGRHPYAFGWTDAAGVRQSYRAASYADAVSRFDALERAHQTFDVGAAQINSRNLKALEARLGIAPLQGLDPCTNLHLAGVILSEQIRVHGPTWRAVAGYNGTLPYAARVFKVYCAGSPEPECRRPLLIADLLCRRLPSHLRIL